MVSPTQEGMLCKRYRHANTMAGNDKAITICTTDEDGILEIPSYSHTMLNVRTHLAQATVATPDSASTAVATTVDQESTCRLPDLDRHEGRWH